MSEILDTVRGVGWISQVQHSDGGWLSWTQWKHRDAATKHAVALLDNPKYDFVAARVVRVDWTVVDTFQHVSAAEQADLEAQAADLKDG